MGLLRAYDPVSRETSRTRKVRVLVLTGSNVPPKNKAKKTERNKKK